MTKSLSQEQLEQIAAIVYAKTVKEFGRCIVIDAPGVCIKEYARRVGLAPITVRQKITAGIIPTIPMGVGDGSTVMVNLMQLAKEAVEREESWPVAV